MKNIFILEKPHSIQRSLILNPPKGYKFIPNLNQLEKPIFKTKFQKIKNKMSYFFLIKNTWEFFKLFYNPVIKKFERSKYLEKDILYKKADLLFSAEILSIKKSYWIDLEHVRQLMGWDIRLFNQNKRWISKQLSKENCKLITSWTKAGINTVIDNLPNSNKFKHKCYFVHNALQSVNFKRKFRDKNKITFLFMSSYNRPFDFNFKGGNIVLESFSRLYQKNKNLCLIVKSWVPPKLLKKYSLVKGIEFQGISPYSKMEKIFKETDIFLSPNHNTPAQAYLDCMNYSIPIITTDLWANSEIVKNNYNGLLIKKSKYVPYFFGKNIPNSRSLRFDKAIKILDEDMVNELVEKMEILVQNWKLRKKLGINGRREIRLGEFSIRMRNKKLKQILDKVIN